jgi:hypothetical protein
MATAQSEFPSQPGGDAGILAAGMRDAGGEGEGRSSVEPVAERGRESDFTAINACLGGIARLAGRRRKRRIRHRHCRRNPASGFLAVDPGKIKQLCLTRLERRNLIIDHRLTLLER